MGYNLSCISTIKLSASLKAFYFFLIRSYYYFEALFFPYFSIIKLIIYFISNLISVTLDPIRRLLMVLFMHFAAMPPHHFNNNMEHNQTKKGHFRFSKAQVILLTVFVAANACIGLFQIMPDLVRRYPPPDHNMKQSIFTPLLGLKRDSHDEQWEAFRANLPIMIFTMFAWKYAVHLLAPKDAALTFLRSFWLGLGLLTFTYRADIFLYLAVVLAWFFMTKALYKTRIIVPLSWSLVIVVLYLNQQYDHLRFISRWFQKFIPDSLAFFKNTQAPLLWTNILNMNFLKMLSFTLDCHWGFNQHNYLAHHQKCHDCREGNLCYRGRDLYKLPEMSLRNYLDYILFAPTCLAGPPISFTNFFSFNEIKSNQNPPYLRVACLVIFFQVYQHFYPVITPDPSQSLLEMALSSILFLYFIYLKFAIIWRMGRLWALMYGVDTIENMGRCMFNNYGFEKFWRMWHKGFNHWLIRYLYIPLGGNKNLLSLLCVILFVAFWHDHTIKILLWALILVVFMIPQIAVKAYFRKHYKHLYSHHWFKYMCALVCSFYIQIICYCNLIGFGYGFENAKVVLMHMEREWLSFVYMTVVISSACILMFYVREVEHPKRND